MYFPKGFAGLKPNFGSTLRAARMAKNLKQEVLAGDVAIRRETLSRIERGRQPRWEVLTRLLAVLDLEDEDVCIKGRGKHLHFADGSRGDGVRNIGEMIIERRRNLRITLAEAAVLTGLSASTLSRLERGQLERSKAFRERAAFADSDYEDRQIEVCHDGLRNFLASSGDQA